MCSRMCKCIVYLLFQLSPTLWTVSLQCIGNPFTQPTAHSFICPWFLDPYPLCPCWSLVGSQTSSWEEKDHFVFHLPLYSFSSLPLSLPSRFTYCCSWATAFSRCCLSGKLQLSFFVTNIWLHVFLLALSLQNMNFSYTYCFSILVVLKFISMSSSKHT